MTTVKQYLCKFFFKYGSKIFFDNGKSFECLSLEDAKRKIPDEYARSFTLIKSDKKITKEIKLNTFFTHEMFLATPETKLTINYNRDIKYTETEHIRGFEQLYNCLNMKKDLPRDYNKYIVMTDFVKKGVEAFFNHIKLVICSDDDDEYDTVTKFLASSVMGHKVMIFYCGNLKNKVEKVLY